MNENSPGFSPAGNGVPDALRDILDALPGPLMFLDASARVAAANAAFTALAPRGVNDMLPGTPFRDVCAAVFPAAQVAALTQGVEDVARSGGPRYSAEACLFCKDRRMWFGLTAARPAGDDGVAAVVALADITRQKHLEEHLQHDAFHDTLTGLYNRAFFISRLETALAGLRTAPRRSFAVLYLDIDRFKLVNKTFGHVTGDRLLMVVANRLLKAAGPRDTLARFGGDEFALLVENTGGAEAATAAAERIMARLMPPFTLRKQQIAITVSIGAVLGTTAYLHPDDILRDADNAMYCSKEHGGNHYTLFDAGMRVTTARRMEMELDLGAALSCGEITVYYQPIVSLASGGVTGFEALARWRHPRYGMIPPMEFIPVAEESNLINVLGDLVLRHACRTLMEMTGKHPCAADMTMSVNISARQFRRPDFVDGVRAVLEETGAPAGRVCLEVTESTLLEDAETAATTMHALKELGIKVVIDDFGTGYSSLSYLQRFPFDSLKVDRSFVCSMTETRQNREIVRTIIAMAESLGLKVVAEGVEMAEHRDMLMALHCEFAQGFLFSEPLAPERLDEFMDRFAAARTACA